MPTYSTDFNTLEFFPLTTGMHNKGTVEIEGAEIPGGVLLLTTAYSECYKNFSATIIFVPGVALKKVDNDSKKKCLVPGLGF